MAGAGVLKVSPEIEAARNRSVAAFGMTTAHPLNPATGRVHPRAEPAQVTELTSGSGLTETFTSSGESHARVGAMATLEDARRIAMGLPQTSEKKSWGSAMWRVKDRGFVWERPLGKKDRADLGDAAPDGEILGVRIADEGEKEALLQSEPGKFFTIPHFDGYPAVLLRLSEIDLDELEEVITDAWLDRAPKRLAAAFLAGRE